MQSGRVLAWRRVATNTATVAVLVLLVKSAAAGKDILLAAWLGTGPMLEIYLVGLLLPTALVNIASSSFSAGLVPQFQKARMTGSLETHRLYSSVLVASFCCALLLTLLLALNRGWILSMTAAGFDSVKLAQATRCFWMLLPLIPMSAIGSLWIGILNSHERFTVPPVAPILTTLCIVAIALTSIDAGNAPAALAAATTLGALFETVALGWALSLAGFSVFPKLKSWHPATRTVLREAGYLSLGTVSMVGVGVLHQSFVASGDAGGIALLNYGSKLGLAAVAILTFAVGAVILPEFSKLAAHREWKPLRRMSWRYIVWTFFILSVTAAILSMFSTSIARTFLERGAFTSADTTAVGRIQIYYFWHLPFVVPGLIATRMLMSLEANRTVLFVGLLNLVVAALITGGLFRRLGVAGVGISSLSMYAVAGVTTVLLAFQSLRNRLHESVPHVADSALIRV